MSDSIPPWTLVSHNGQSRVCWAGNLDTMTPEEIDALLKKYYQAIISAKKNISIAKEELKKVAEYINLMEVANG